MIHLVVQVRTEKINLKYLYFIFSIRKSMLGSQYIYSYVIIFLFYIFPFFYENRFLNSWNKYWFSYTNNIVFTHVLFSFYIFYHSENTHRSSKSANENSYVDNLLIGRKYYFIRVVIISEFFRHVWKFS